MSCLDQKLTILSHGTSAIGKIANKEGLPGPRPPGNPRIPSNSNSSIVRCSMILGERDVMLQVKRGLGFILQEVFESVLTL